MTTIEYHIPERFKKAKYEYVLDEIRQLFAKIPDSRNGIYIYGGAGVGKTHTAYALKQASYEVLGKKAKFYNTTELLRDIRNDFGKDPNKDYTVSKEIMEYRGVLILDDIGAEKISEWVLETFYLIINKRYNEMLPTIFTSNFSVSELSEYLGDRITSRIVGMCNIVEMKGSDRRIKSL